MLCNVLLQASVSSGSKRFDALSYDYRFRNPCCCPCYLVGACGCLGTCTILIFWTNDLSSACFECLACGLCAEGLAQEV